MFDLIIIGGGPGGVAAGVYASRKRLKTLFITNDWGGQSNVSTDIQNWIGTQHTSGADFATMLQEHLRAYASDVVEIQEKTTVISIEKTEHGFDVLLEGGARQSAKTVLITTGSERKKLSVPGAEKYDQKGLTYCASCDGPMFSGQDVAVIGGGNAGFETAAQLLEYAKSVTLLHRSEQYKADPITAEKVLSHKNMTGLLDAHISEVVGEQFVTGLSYTLGTDGEKQMLPVGGIFVEIGLVPNTAFATELLDIDALNRITIDPWTQRTSVEGVWAAGDCTNIHYHQNNISAGDAVRALEDIYLHLRTK